MGSLPATALAALVVWLPAAALVGFAEVALALEFLLVLDAAFGLGAALPGLLVVVLVDWVDWVDLVLAVFFAWVFLALMPAFMASPATSFKAADAMV